MKKNTASFVLALLAAIFGVIGGLMWTACADACASVTGSGTGYVVGFIILGIGGAIIALIGGIRAYGLKSGSFGLLVLGLVMQIGQLILACIAIEGFSFILNIWTIAAIILLIIAIVIARKKTLS